MIIVLYLPFTYSLAIRYLSFCDPILYVSFLGFQLYSIHTNIRFSTTEVGIYKRKQESKKESMIHFRPKKATKKKGKTKNDLEK